MPRRRRRPSLAVGEPVGPGSGDGTRGAGREAGRDTAAQEAVYQELILRHYRHPHGKGRVPDADAEATVRNPLCGEDVTVSLTVDRGSAEAPAEAPAGVPAEAPAGVRLREVRFAGQGCAISQASASMMTDLVAGRSVSEIAGLADRLRALLRGDPAAAADEGLGPLRALSGIARVPARIPCALLPWEALGQALQRAAVPRHPAER